MNDKTINLISYRYNHIIFIIYKDYENIIQIM